MKERIVSVAKIATTVYVATKLSESAFSFRSRKKILERDGYKCVRCGATDHLEAAHINHNRNRSDYDDPSNGRTLCTEHHLEDHINREGRNGLTKRHNRWAIKRLRQKARRNSGD